MSVAYRDTHVSSDDSEDSDEECTVWKRATVKRTEENIVVPKIETEEQIQPPIEQSLKRKRNTIWCEVLQDQLISEDLEDCLLKNKPRNYGSRGRESYDYSLKYTNPRDSDSTLSDNAMEEESSKPKRKPSFRRDVKKFVKLDGAELTAARRINKVLQEKKFYLIQRIVKTVGIEKAMKLLTMTEEKEENGGMMINNNTRRRTPGGVYIQLLKSDKEVTKEMLDKIFEGEMSGVEIKKYYKELKKKKKKGGNNKQKLNEFKKEKNDEMQEADEMVKEKNDEMQEADEMVPMEAEITGDIKCEKLSLDNPEPVCDLTAAKNNSDLEEGEIED